MSARYEWPAGKSCAVVFSADVDAESPMLWTHRGRQIGYLGELEQRRFGPRQGLWRILDMIEGEGLRGSFYVPGVVAETYPAILPELVRRGHEIGLHGYYHERADQASDAQTLAWIDRSAALFEAQTGRRPRGYRSPSWELSVAMPGHLKDRGLAYDSSLMGFDHPYTIDGLPEVPVQWLVDDAIYFKFAGNGSDRGAPIAPHLVLESWLAEYRAMREFGGLFMITIHPWISGRGQRVLMLRELIRTIARDSDVWWATAEEVADWHAASANAGRFAVTAAGAGIDPEREAHP